MGNTSIPYTPSVNPAGVNFKTSLFCCIHATYGSSN